MEGAGSGICFLLDKMSFDYVRFLEYFSLIQLIVMKFKDNSKFVELILDHLKQYNPWAIQQSSQ